jgi:hypothetical protein
MSFYTLAVTTVMTLWAVGCSAASHDTADASDDGNHRPTGSHDGGASDASDASIDVVEDFDFPVFMLDAGSTWTALYRDYFGNPKSAACAGTGNGCHGNIEGAGYGQSGYLCPIDDKDGCYKGITLSFDAGGFGLIAPGPGAAYANSELSNELRLSDGGGGGMPQSPPYAFTPVDIDRISAWIEAGAPNN